MPFDPFRRFRLRPNPVSTLPSSSEEDSDESSPERGRPRIIHVSAPKHAHKSADHPLHIPDSRKSASDKLTESTHIAVTLPKSPHLDRPSKKQLKSGVARCV